MTNLAWANLALYLLVTLLLAWPLSRWVTALAQGRVPSWLAAIERPLFRLCGIKPDEGMGWKQYAIALLVFNFIGVLAVYALQRLQGVLPLNPQAMPAISPDSAFNTAISFVANTN